MQAERERAALRSRSHTGTRAGAADVEDDAPRQEADMTYRILVVDDEPDITALVAYHLAKAGFRVSTAANGPDALRAARRRSPTSSSST